MMGVSLAAKEAMRVIIPVRKAERASNFGSRISQTIEVANVKRERI
jgi:hypothetical protein